MTGREELFKLLLSQESPASSRPHARLLRLLQPRAHRRASTPSPASSRSLRSSSRRRRASKRTSRRSKRRKRARSRRSRRSRDERRAAVAKLDAEIRDGTAAVAKLRGRGAAARGPREARRASSWPASPSTPTSRSRARRASSRGPCRAALAGDFGQSRGAGPVKWNGVLLEASAGTPVRAVYHGRVAFADWLQGLGLLVIVDHGGGYMSLYGHNEALLEGVRRLGRARRDRSRKSATRAGSRGPACTSRSATTASPSIRTRGSRAPGALTCGAVT